MGIDLKDYKILRAAYQNRFHGSGPTPPFVSPYIPLEDGDKHCSTIKFYSDGVIVYRIDWYPKLTPGNFGSILEFEEACHKLHLRGIYPTKIECGMFYDQILQICVEGENPACKFEKIIFDEPTGNPIWAVVDELDEIESVIPSPKPKKKAKKKKVKLEIEHLHEERKMRF